MLDKGGSKYLRLMEEAPFFPSNENESCYSIKWVKTKSLQGCANCQYCKAPDSAKDSFSRFPRGTYMIKETAVIRELGWRSSYICTYCLDWWAKEINFENN